jgi:RNA polymerase sigma factor (sigma-70 family)
MPPGQLQPVVRQIRQLAGEPLAERDDAFLLKQFVAGRDERAFETLVRRHGRLVRSVCRHVLGSEDDIDDAFQATFFVLARKAAAIRKRQSLASWLHGVAHRAALNARKSAMRRRLRESRPEQFCGTDLKSVLPHKATTEQPVTEAALREVQAILDEEVQRLPEKLRSPFVSCCLEGKSKAEAARELGWREGTVSGRLARAREQLRDRLTRRGVSLPAALCALAVTGEATAVLPVAVVTATTQAAIRFLASGGEGASAILATQAIQGMAGGKFKAIALVMLSLLAASAIGYLVPADRDRPEEAPNQARDWPKARSQEVKTDAYGDPVPEGALVRMGTIRFRHADAVHCTVFAPDGKTLISCGCDGVIRLWDVATGKELRRFVGHRGRISLIALSPNGGLLASWGMTGSNGDGVRVWEIATGKEMRRLQGPKEGHLMSLAWSPDNETLAAGGDDGTMRAWDAIAGNELRNIPCHSGAIGSIAFSLDGTILASAGGYKDGTIRVLDLTGKREPLVIRGREKEFHFVTFAPEGKTLISGGDCYGDNWPKVRSVNTIALWDAASGKRLREFRVGDDQEKPHEGAASVALSADGKTLALGYWDLTIRLWDVESGKPLRKLSGFPDRSFCPAYHVAFSADGKMLSACGSNHAVCLPETVTGKPLFHDGPAQKGDIRSVALSPNGKILATASHDYTVCLWDAVKGTPLHQLRGHTNWVYTVTFAPDGRIVASGSSDGTVRLWNVATGKEVRRLAAEEQEKPGGLGKSQVACLAFSPDGRVLASSHDFGDMGILRLWDTELGTELRRLETPSLLFCGALAFSCDGRSLFAVGEDKIIHRWHVATGKEFQKHAVTGHKDLTESTISPDSRLAATGDQDGLVQVWDTRTGRPLVAINCEKGTGYRLVFSPDGRYLALCGASYNDPDNIGRLAIELWELASGKLVRKQPLPPQTGVGAAVFAPDGRRLAAGMGDTSALIWDMGPQRPSAGAGRQTMPQGRLEDHWAALAGDDAVKAYEAIGELVDAPEATAFLKLHLQPASRPDPQRLEELLADLDNDVFSVREGAARELEKLGDAAPEAYRKALEEQPSPERRRRIEKLLSKLETRYVVSGEDLRALRAIQILERIASVDARQVLHQLAAGAADSRLTREAKAALELLQKRQPTP